MKRFQSTQLFLKLGFLFLFISVVAAPLQALRIVSLLPSNTEILESLNAGDHVVGVTRFDRSTQGREVVGDFFQPNLEKIVALKPDLILAGLHASSRTGARLKAMGFKLVEIRNPGTLEELYGSIRTIAQLVEREARAAEVIADMQSRLARVAERSRRSPRLRTYIELDTPFWTLGGRDFLHEAAALAGADNIFADLERPSAQVSPEVIVERDPELIITFDLKKHEIARRTGWDKITAIRRGYVLDDLDRDALSRPSPRLVDGIEELQRRIERLVKP